MTFEASAADHRCKAICLTEKAMNTHARIEAHIQSEEARLVAHMTEAEVREFRRLLRMAADNLGVCTLPPPHKPHTEESDL